MAHVCRYCQSEFKTKSYLNYHQKNTKYCIEKQGEYGKQFTCKYCDKSVSSEKRLKTHYNICSEYSVTHLREEYEDKLEEKEELIRDLRQQIKELQNKLENIALKAVLRPTTTNMNKTEINNYIQNILNHKSHLLILIIKSIYNLLLQRVIFVKF